MSISLPDSAGVSVYAIAAVTADRLAACAGLIDAPDRPVEYVQTYENLPLDRASICAATLALQKVAPGQPVTLHVACRRVCDAISSGSLLRWRDDDWKARVGKKPVKNSDLWKLLLKEVTQRAVEVRLVSPHANTCLARCFRAAQQTLDAIGHKEDASHDQTDSEEEPSLLKPSQVGLNSTPAHYANRFTDRAATTPHCGKALRESWCLALDASGGLRLRRKATPLQSPSTMTVNCRA